MFHHKNLKLKIILKKLKVHSRESIKIVLNTFERMINKSTFHIHETPKYDREIDENF